VRGIILADSSKLGGLLGHILCGMETELKNAPVLVTGASKGIGRAIAVAFGREQARVAITYRDGREDAEVTAAAVRDAGGEAMTARFLLESPETAAQAVDEVRERFGGLTVLVNNAVHWPSGRNERMSINSGFRQVEDFPWREWAVPVQANIVGTFAMIQAALPLLRKSEWARIVTISTGLVVDGLPGSSAYTAGKAALHGLNRTLAKELGPAGILTNILMSGAVDTRPRPPALIEQMKQSAVTGRLTDADEVARTAVFLGSRANGHITGEALRCDGFFVSAVRRA
jgi:NAD(P)-dependent dehydrogenase (short-subunit alcohol dehydrogenase family)